MREVTGSMKRSRQALRENSEKIATHLLALMTVGPKDQLDRFLAQLDDLVDEDFNAIIDAADAYVVEHCDPEEKERWRIELNSCAAKPLHQGQPN